MVPAIRLLFIAPEINLLEFGKYRSPILIMLFEYYLYLPHMCIHIMRFLSSLLRNLVFNIFLLYLCSQYLNGRVVCKSSASDKMLT